MRKQLFVLIAAAGCAAVGAGAAVAGPGPSGSSYSPNGPNNYGTECAEGERVDAPEDASIFAYNGPDGVEVCVQQREPGGWETGPLSGRAWVTSDGVVHVDAPTAMAAPFAPGVFKERTELETDGQQVRANSYGGSNSYTDEQRDTYSPLDGHIRQEHAGNGYSGGGGSTSDTWIGTDGYRSESAHDYSGDYGSVDRGSSQTSLGADGYRSESASEYGDYYSGSTTESSQRSIGPDGVHVHDETVYYDNYWTEQSWLDADVDSNGAVVNNGYYVDNDFGYLLVSATPDEGVTVEDYESGYDECYQYGSSRQGVHWNPLGDPGSLPTVVDENTRPPCDY